MGFMQAATAHYQQKSQAPLKSFEVPEYGLTIYYRPAGLTVGQRGILTDLSTDENGNTDSGAIMFETLRMRMLDEQGQPLLKKADKPVFLHEVAADVAANILIQIRQGSGDLSEDDAAKN